MQRTSLSLMLDHLSESMAEGEPYTNPITHRPAHVTSVSSYLLLILTLGGSSVCVSLIADPDKKRQQLKPMVCFLVLFKAYSDGLNWFDQLLAHSWLLWRAIIVEVSIFMSASSHDLSRFCTR